MRGRRAPSKLVFSASPTTGPKESSSGSGALTGRAMRQWERQHRLAISCRQSWPVWLVTGDSAWILPAARASGTGGARNRLASKIRASTSRAASGLPVVECTMRLQPHGACFVPLRQPAEPARRGAAVARCRVQRCLRVPWLPPPASAKAVCRRAGRAPRPLQGSG
jgi:hypothetical protein